ncbi:MAG TPA: MAPEG family protein [Rhizomicrobium sp.]|nr:MAPEG family protein [Rhizomicrobium sp.]
MQFIHNLPIFELSLGGMTTEHTMLALAAILGLFQLLIAARTGNSQRGLKWNVGARDEAPPSVSKVAGRLERASRNFMETFPFFAVAVLLLGPRHNWATVWGSELYLAARLVYLPLYGFGVPGLRTLVWLVATLSILLLFAAVFYPAI